MPRLSPSCFFFFSLLFLFSLFHPSSQGRAFRIYAQDGEEGDSFGSSTAVDGPLVVVGAPSDDVGSNVNQGSAYIFNCSSETMILSSPPPNCTQIAQLFASNGAAGDNFGSVVAILGSLVAVGAPAADSNQGAVYLFSCTNSSCTQQGLLSPGLGGNYGIRIALSGHLLAVSASSLNNQGSVFAYDCSNPAACSLLNNFTASDVADLDQFGFLMSLSGSTIIVGLANKNSSAGAVYLFSCSSSSCSQVARLTAAGSLNFGSFVAISGMRLVIGATEVSTSKTTAHIYDCPSLTSCSLFTKIIISDTTAASISSVAISGPLISFGNPNDRSLKGSVATYACPPSSACSSVGTFSFPLSGFEESLGLESYGWSVSSSGVVVVAGAPFHDVSGRVDQGSVTLYYVLHCPANTYGNVQWPNTPSNAVATVPCNPGYTGTPSRYCYGLGYWVDLIENVCVQNQCAPRTEFDADWPLTTQGQISRGTCLPGFVGSPTRVCLANGTFASSLLSGFCIPPSSGSCPAETYGNANWPGDALLGSYATGTCIAGWTGSPLRKCTFEGTWEVSIMNHCERILCPAETVNNIEWPQTYQGIKANGICINGMIGAPTRYCNSIGQWLAVVDPCKPFATCPAELYARANWEETQPGNTAHGTCINGWTGNPSRICKQDGTWQDLVREHCIRI